MDSKNDTSSERIRQGISRNLKVVDNKDTKADTLPKQYGKIPFGITSQLTNLSARALLLYLDMSQLFWGENNSLNLTTNPITDDGLAKRTGYSLAKIARARKELVDSGVVEIIKTAHADTGKLKRVFRFSQVEEMGEDKPQPEAPNSQDRIGAIDRNEQHQLTEPVNPTLQNLSIPNEGKKSVNSDGDSVSVSDGSKPLLHSSTSNNYYYNYNNPTDSINQLEEMIENGGEDELKRIQQTYWPAPDKDRMRGSLADLLNQIAQEFDFPSTYAFKLLEEVSRDKGGIKFPQGFTTQAGMEHLTQKAKPLKREIKEQKKQEQEKHEQKLKEKAERQREEERKHRQTVFQDLGSQFDKDVQNSIKGVIMDSSVYYRPFGEERALEAKIDTFLSGQEEIIKSLYAKHVETSLDSDDVMEKEKSDGMTEREKALKKYSETMWGRSQAETRLGDFCDFIKEKILSDKQLHSPFTLDDDSKPQPPDTAITRAEPQPTKPSTPDQTEAKPKEGLPPMAGGGFNEGLKLELIKQGIARLDSSPPDDYATWVNKMETYNMLANAGMTKGQLWKAVISQSGDKSSPKSDKVSQQEAQNCAPTTVQDATEETQLALFG